MTPTDILANRFHLEANAHAQTAAALADVLTENRALKARVAELEASDRTPTPTPEGGVT